MPDADIPPVILTDDDIAQMQADFPTMPAEYRAKFTEIGVDDGVVRVLLNNQQVAIVVNDVLAKSNQTVAKRIANLFASCLPTSSDEDDSAKVELSIPSVDNLIKLAQMLDDKKVSSTAGKEIFAEMLKADADPMQIAENKKLLQVSDEGAIEKIVDEVIADPACAKAVADFKTGQEKVIGFLVGQVMKKSKGQANPSMAQQILRRKLQ